MTLEILNESKEHIWYITSALSHKYCVALYTHEFELKPNSVSIGGTNT